MKSRRKSINAKVALNIGIPKLKQQCSLGIDRCNQDQIIPSLVEIKRLLSIHFYPLNPIECERVTGLIDGLLVTQGHVIENIHPNIAQKAEEAYDDVIGWEDPSDGILHSDESSFPLSDTQMLSVEGSPMMIHDSMKDSLNHQLEEKCLDVILSPKPTDITDIETVQRSDISLVSIPFKSPESTPQIDNLRSKRRLLSRCGESALAMVATPISTRKRRRSLGLLSDKKESISLCATNIETMATETSENDSTITKDPCVSHANMAIDSPKGMISESNDSNNADSYCAWDIPYIDYDMPDTAVLHFDFPDEPTPAIIRFEDNSSSYNNSNNNTTDALLENVVLTNTEDFGEKENLSGVDKCELSDWNTIDQVAPTRPKRRASISCRNELKRILGGPNVAESSESKGAGKQRGRRMPLKNNEFDEPSEKKSVNVALEKHTTSDCVSSLYDSDSNPSILDEKREMNKMAVEDLMSLLRQSLGDNPLRFLTKSSNSIMISDITRHLDIFQHSFPLSKDVDSGNFFAYLFLVLLDHRLQECNASNKTPIEEAFWDIGSILMMLLSKNFVSKFQQACTNSEFEGLSILYTALHGQISDLNDEKEFVESSKKKKKKIRFVDTNGTSIYSPNDRHIDSWKLTYIEAFRWLDVVRLSQMLMIEMKRLFSKDVVVEIWSILGVFCESNTLQQLWNEFAPSIVKDGCSKSFYREAVYSSRTIFPLLKDIYSNLSSAVEDNAPHWKVPTSMLTLPQSLLCHQISWYCTSVLRYQLRWLLDPPPSFISSASITGQQSIYDTYRSDFFRGVHSIPMKKSIVQDFLLWNEELSIEPEDGYEIYQPTSTAELTVSYLFSEALRQVRHLFVAIVGEENCAQPSLIAAASTNTSSSIDTNCATLLDSMSSLESKAFAAQMIVAGELSRKFLLNLLSLKPFVSLQNQFKSRFNIIKKCGEVIGVLKMHDDIHWTLLQEGVEALVPLVKKSFISATTVKKCKQAIKDFNIHEKNSKIKGHYHDHHVFDFPKIDTI